MSSFNHLLMLLYFPGFSSNFSGKSGKMSASRRMNPIAIEFHLDGNSIHSLSREIRQNNGSAGR